MAAHLQEGGSQVISKPREEAFHFTAHVLQMAIEQGNVVVVFCTDVLLKLETVDLDYFANHFK